MFELFKPSKKTPRERELERVVALEDDIILAETIRKHLSEGVGAYLVKKMEIDLADIKKKLVEVDAAQPEIIRTLQSQYHAINSLKKYLADALRAGEAAQSQLDASAYKGNK